MRKSKSFIKCWFPSIAVLSLLSPLLGMTIVTVMAGDPGLLFSTLDGKPVLFSFAYLPSLPVVLPSSFLWCYFLQKSIIKREGRGEKPIRTQPLLLYLVIYGALFGLFSASPFLFTFFNTSEGILWPAIMLISAQGCVNGMVCSLFCYPFWRKNSLKDLNVEIISQ